MSRGGAGDEDEAAAGDSVVLGADALEIPGLLPGTGLLPAAPERDFGDGQAYEGLGGSGAKNSSRCTGLASRRRQDRAVEWSGNAWLVV